MATANMKFFAIYKISSEKLIYHVSTQQNQEDSMKAEGFRVFMNIKNIGLQAQERQQINTGLGNWFCKIDDKDVAYVSLASANYPERHTYGMIKQLQDDLATLGDYGSMDEVSIKFNIKGKMVELANTYSDIRNVDQMAVINENVESVRSQMETNVKKMLDNKSNLDTLDGKSSTMSKAAQTFSQQSTDLERIMYWRKVQLNVIIFLVVIGLIAYIAFPFIASYIAEKEEKQATSSSGSTSSTHTSGSRRFLEILGDQMIG